MTTASGIKYSMTVTFFMLTFSGKVFAQSNKEMNAKNLAISFVALTNKYQHKNQALATFTVKNNSNQSLPAAGWHIYFNSKNAILVQEPSAFFTIKQLNGNLFQLSPVPGFKGISPKQYAAMQVIMDGQVLNRNDQPEGFYFVWDDAQIRGLI